MKRIYSLQVAATAFFTAIAVTACVPESQETKFIINPEFEAVDEEDVELDFTDLHNDTIEAFGNISRTPYIFVTDLDIDGDNEERLIEVNGTVITDTDQTDSQIFTIALMRHISDAAAGQYPNNFDISSPEDFGNIYDLYSFRIVLCDEDDGSVIFEYELEAGDEIEFNPDIESYEEDWLEYMELSIEGQIDSEIDDDTDEEELSEEE